MPLPSTPTLPLTPLVLARATDIRRRTSVLAMILRLLVLHVVAAATPAPDSTPSPNPRSIRLRRQPLVHKIHRTRFIPLTTPVQRTTIPLGIFHLVAEAHVSRMPLAVLVDERLLAVFAVPEGLVGRDLADVEPGVRAQGGGVEDDVDFFQRAVAGFGVEEVD